MSNISNIPIQLCIKYFIQFSFKLSKYSFSAQCQATKAGRPEKCRSEEFLHVPCNPSQSGRNNPDSFWSFDIPGCLVQRWPGHKVLALLHGRHSTKSPGQHWTPGWVHQPSVWFKLVFWVSDEILLWDYVDTFGLRLDEEVDRSTGGHKQMVQLDKRVKTPFRWWFASKRPTSFFSSTVKLKNENFLEIVISSNNATPFRRWFQLETFFFVLMINHTHSHTKVPHIILNCHQAHWHCMRLSWMQTSEMGKSKRKPKIVIVIVNPLKINPLTFGNKINVSYCVTANFLIVVLLLMRKSLYR